MKLSTAMLVLIYQAKELPLGAFSDTLKQLRDAEYIELVERKEGKRDTEFLIRVTEKGQQYVESKGLKI